MTALDSKERIYSPMPIRKYTGPTPPSSNNNNNNNNNNNAATPPTQPTTATQAADIDLPQGLSAMHAGTYRPVDFCVKEIYDLIIDLN